MIDKTLPNGTRVRNHADQYPRAIREGTATVTGHFINGRFLKYRVRLDEPYEPGVPMDQEWPADRTLPINTK